jgi:hypothetical protein
LSGQILLESIANTAALFAMLLDAAEVPHTKLCNFRKQNLKPTLLNLLCGNATRLLGPFVNLPTTADIENSFVATGCQISLV